MRRAVSRYADVWHKFSPQRISRIYSRTRGNVSRIPPRAWRNFFSPNCYNYVDCGGGPRGTITWLPLISAPVRPLVILCKIMEMSNYARWLNYKRLSRNWVNLNCGINGYLTRFRLVESRWCDDIAKVINDDDSRGWISRRAFPLLISLYLSCWQQLTAVD